jgi:hypothetical protein
MRIWTVTAIAFSFLLAAQAAFAGQVVVVDSSMPALAPGKVIDADSSITLPAGARVTVVGDDGRMQTLKGPFSGAVGARSGAGGNPAVVDTLSRLFSSPAETAALGTFRGAEPQLGGFRGAGSAGGGADAPELWAINVQRAGEQCVPAAGGLPTLWRPDAVREATVVVQRLPDGPGGLVRFAAGSQSVPWPAGVALQDGDYTLRDSADAWASTVSLRVVPAELEDDVRRVVWMADHGCSRQAKALLANMN